MDTASVRERGTAAPALGTVSLSLESFPALERALPLAVLLLWIPVVALAQDQLLYLGLCSICMTVNIALSRVVSLLPASARVPLEVAKNAFGMLFVALVPILWESGVPVWLAAIPSLIRLAAIMPLGRATQLLMPGHVLAAVLGVGLAAGSVAPALLPACALSAIALLNLLVVGQMQRSLRTSAVRSACIQQSGDLFYQVSPDGYILDCNEVVLERLGCTREELMGRSVVTLYDEESQEKSLANVETVRREGSIKDVEMTVVPFEGEPFPVLLSARVLLDQDGSPLSTVSIQRDVSQLEARGRELRAALLQAERAASVKGDFLATM
ncbi:MAG: PAS domain-containing protein, partial [Planctomycetota bacterium]